MTESIALAWTIDNYSKFDLKVGEYVESPEFVINKQKEKWTIKFYPNGDQENPDKVVCFLKRSAGVEIITIGFCFVFLNSEGTIFISKKIIYKKFKINDEGRYVLTHINHLQKKMEEWSADNILTLQCVIVKPKSNHAEEFTSKSEVGFDHITFVWRVKEPDSSGWLQQKLFQCTKKISLEVTLSTDRDYRGILMEEKNVSNSKVDSKSQFINRKITLVDVNNIEIKAITLLHKFSGSSNNNSCKIPTLISMTSLKNCIQNGYFTLIFEFSIPNGITITKELSGSITYEFNAQMETKRNFDAVEVLQYDLKQMLLDKKHSDVNIRADGQLFCAHRCLLSSRSPVFRAMFDSEMLEAETNAVDIEDVDSITLDNLLKFLYTGIIGDNDWENILRAMLAADKYQIESLTEKCAEILMDLLSVENVLDIIKIADLVKHKDLKASALYLIKQHAKDILSSTEWLEWSKQNIQLAFEISSELALQYALKN